MAGIKEHILSIRDRKNLLQWSFPPLLMLLSLLLLLLFRGWGALDREEKALFPRWNAAKVSRIVQVKEGWELVRMEDSGESSWRIHDNAGGSWPVDNEAVEALSGLPGALKDHPLYRKRSNDPTGTLSTGSVVWEYSLEDQKEPLQLEVQPLVRGGFLFVWDGEIYSADLPLPDGQMTSYLALAPLKEIRPGAVSSIQLYTPLEGAAAEQFRYQLEPKEEGWVLNPGARKLDPDVFQNYLLEIQDLRAVSMIRSQDWDMGNIRFIWALADRNNRQWVLRLGLPISREETTFWPLEVEGEPWIYLFTREDLQKLARPAEFFVVEP